MINWQGVFPAVTTKFQENFALDIAAMESHFAWQIQSSVDGLITTGSLGEASVLTLQEKITIAKIAVAVSGEQVPVLATVAETTTASAVKFVQQAEAAGVDGFMVLPGMQYVSDRNEALAHLREIARASGKPLMVYNNPVAYRVDIDLDTLDALAEEPRYVAIKESSDDVRRVTAIRNKFGNRFNIFSGVDNLALESLFMGADGWVAGLVDAFPEETVAIYRLYKAGRYDEALALYRWFSPLLALDVSTKLVQNIKLVESVVGVGRDIVRPPRQPLTGAERASIEALVRDAIARRPEIPDWRRAA